MTKYVKEKMFLYSSVIDVGKTLEIGCSSSEYSGFFKDHVGLNFIHNKFSQYTLDSHYLHHIFDYGEFDTVLWLETAEHDSAFWLTVKEIDYVLRPGGYLAISVPSLVFPYHGYPNDYWRFTEDGFRRLFMDYTMIDFDIKNKANPPYGDYPEHSAAYVGLGVKPLTRE